MDGIRPAERSAGRFMSLRPARSARSDGRESLGGCTCARQFHYALIKPMRARPRLSSCKTTPLNTLWATGKCKKAKAFVDGVIRAGGVGVKPPRDRFIDMYMSCSAMPSTELRQRDRRSHAVCPAGSEHDQRATRQRRWHLPAADILRGQARRRRNDRVDGTRGWWLLPVAFAGSSIWPTSIAVML